MDSQEVNKKMLGDLKGSLSGLTESVNKMAADQNRMFSSFKSQFKNLSKSNKALTKAITKSTALQTTAIVGALDSIKGAVDKSLVETKNQNKKWAEQQAKQNAKTKQASASKNIKTEEKSSKLGDMAKTVKKALSGGWFKKLLSGLGLGMLLLNPQGIAKSIKELGENFKKVVKVFKSDDFKTAIENLTKFATWVAGFAIDRFAQFLDGLAGTINNFEKIGKAWNKVWEGDWKGALETLGTIDLGDFGNVAAGLAGLALVFKPFQTTGTAFKAIRWFGSKGIEILKNFVTNMGGKGPKAATTAAANAATGTGTGTAATTAATGTTTGLLIGGGIVSAIAAFFNELQVLDFRERGLFGDSKPGDGSTPTGSQLLLEQAQRGMRFQKGGSILGYGTGDKIPAMLEPGEYVLNKNAVSQIGSTTLDALNFALAPRFQKGGSVDGFNESAFNNNFLNGIMSLGGPISDFLMKRANQKLNTDKDNKGTNTNEQTGGPTNNEGTPTQTSGGGTVSGSAAKGIFDLIARGEGGYNSVNQGRAGDTPGGARSIMGRDLTEMTVAEVVAAQRSRLFAVGKYQIIPKTMTGFINWALKNGKFSMNDKFNAATQEHFKEYVINVKRPAVGAYLRGETNDPTAAGQALAREFASVGLQYAEAGRPRGSSRYAGTGGNRASISPEAVIAALQRDRQMRMSTATNNPKLTPNGGMSPEEVQAAQGKANAARRAGQMSNIPGGGNPMPKLSTVRNEHSQEFTQTSRAARQSGHFSNQPTPVVVKVDGGNKAPAMSGTTTRGSSVPNLAAFPTNGAALDYFHRTSLSACLS